MQRNNAIVGNDMTKPRLQEVYEQKVRPALQKELELSNIMQVPKIDKIVINVGVKAAEDSSKAIKAVSAGIAKIAGQAPVITKARKSIAGFKIREDMPLGVKVTLRGKRMYNFLDKLINIALPRVRDFQGVKKNFDLHGNYNLGVKEWTIFPEIVEYSEKLYGMNITFHMNAGNGNASFALLKQFGMPFRK